MSEPDPAPPAAESDSDPGSARIKRRSKTSRRVKTKVRTADNSEGRRKSRKKILELLKTAGLWALAMAGIWVGLKVFLKPPPAVDPQGLHRPPAPAGSPWSA